MNKLIAFGDIHGYFEAAITAVRISEEMKAQAIFLGDYVDRGPSAVKTLRVLIEAKEKHPDWIFLRGNHDQMLLDLINKKAVSDDFGKVLDINFDYNQASDSYEEWKQLENDEQLSILNFLNSTLFYYENKKYIFSHAIINLYGGEVYQKSNDLLIWNYNYNPRWFGKMFVHGHSPVKHPSMYYNGINVNTECGYGGNLTGVITNTENNLLDFYSITEGGEVLGNFKILNNQYTKDSFLRVQLSDNNEDEIEIIPYDYEGLYTWNEAIAACEKLGGSWRLPTVEEMKAIYRQCFKAQKGQFLEKEYWCVHEDNKDEALYFDFYAGSGLSDMQKDNKLKIRPVRKL